MKTAQLYRFILSIFLLSANFCASAQCPPWGSEPKGSPLGNLNTAKNRSIARPARRPVELSLSDILGKLHGPDAKRYTNGQYVTISGIITDVVEKGPESSNCNMAKKGSGDTHIYLGLDVNDDKEDCMIVEITPAYKARHRDYAKNLNKGTHVKISGYMLYDFEHKGNAKNTAKTEKDVWRKTCWEIHPVTDVREIKVVE
jgi:hypothetical protein